IVVNAMLAVLLVFFVVVKLYYQYCPGPLIVNPTKVAILKPGEGSQKFLDRATEDGTLIIRNAYGSYADYVIENDSLPVSTPAAIAFTLPPIQYDGQYYFLREHALLKYRLWAHQPPQSVLLGSSIFFNGFNREAFFTKYPEVKLLDFTTGNNTPFIAN